MKFDRKASAVWQGGGETGEGKLTTGSGELNNTAYEFKTRFKDAKGTNPEELIGAAYAGCYTMQLAFFLEEEGYTATKLHTDATVYFADGSIPKIDLTLEGEVPNISADEFKKIAEKAKKECPVGKLLNAEKNLTVTLV